MKIEILYPEFSNLYGDYGNILYIEKTLKDAEIIKTSINDTPAFVNGDVDLIYIGSLSESHQELVTKILSKYKTNLKKYIENDKVLLATGNSFEIFGNYILSNDQKIECLGILNFYSERDFLHRHNSLFLGEFNNIKIVGNKSSFSKSYRNNNYNFIKRTRGVGLNQNDEYEGIKHKNFFGTYLLGPFLAINPLFTKYLFNIIGYKGNVAFEKESIDAYNYKLSELENPKTTVESKH